MPSTDSLTSPVAPQRPPAKSTATAPPVTSPARGVARRSSRPVSPVSGRYVTLASARSSPGTAACSVPVANSPAPSAPALRSPVTTRASSKPRWPPAVKPGPREIASEASVILNGGSESVSRGGLTEACSPSRSRVTSIGLRFSSGMLGVIVPLPTRPSSAIRRPRRPVLRYGYVNSICLLLSGNSSRPVAPGSTTFRGKSPPPLSGLTASGSRVPARTPSKLAVTVSWRWSTVRCSDFSTMPGISSRAGWLAWSPAIGSGTVGRISGVTRSTWEAAPAEIG